MIELKYFILMNFLYFSSLSGVVKFHAGLSIFHEKGTTYVKSKFKSLACLSNIIGCVDGTQRKILAPSRMKMIRFIAKAFIQ